MSYELIKTINNNLTIMALNIMMKKSKILQTAMIVYFFGFVSCAVQKKSSSEIRLKQVFPTAVNFNCVEQPSDYDCISSQVYLKMDEFDFMLDTIYECTLISKQDYANYQMPDSVLAACGGWCGGLGEFFYSIKSGKDIVVFKGWMDEMQEDDGYHYKEFKRFIFVE